MTKKISVLILAAGQGTRMKSDLPKVLHKIGGRSLIQHVLGAAESLNPENITVVLAPSMRQVADHVQPHKVAYQDKPLGTGHAVRAAGAILGEFSGDIIIMFGDTPFIETRTMENLIARRGEKDNPALVLLGMRPESSKGYGRYVIDQEGYLLKVVEERDASDAEKEIGLCNGGVMLADGSVLWRWIKELSPHNAQGEYYLTDLVTLAWKNGRKAAYLEVPESEVLGINDHIELANAEKIFQNKRRKEIMERGVTLIDPETVYFSADTLIERGCVIGPHVVFGPKVQLHSKVEIRPFCHIEGAEIGEGAILGPFTRVRPDTHIGKEARIGNFVEVKNSVVENQAKANHLSYLGDSKIGAKANIGAGTITCNYDGFTKFTTEIGAGAFIGSNSALVAPVRIGKGAIIGAGSVITDNVEENALALARAKQEQKPGWAAKFREWRKK